MSARTSSPSAAVAISPQTDLRFTRTDDDDLAALADLASQMLLAATLADRLRLGAHAVQAHLDRPVGAGAFSGSAGEEVAWAGAVEEEQDAILRAVAALDTRPDETAGGTVGRTSVDGLSLTLVSAGAGWVAVVDAPDDAVRFLRAVGDVVGSALSTATTRSEEGEMSLVWSAHELRSPLMTVRMAIEQAIRSRRSSERRVLLEGGLRELEQLSVVTESLLRFRPDGSEREGAAVDLGSLVPQMLLDHAGSERVETLCETGVWAVVDPVQFRIAVMNLVRNAEAHTVDGPVVVRVFRDGDRSVVSVEDRGDGVAPELRERIFDPYVRGGPSQGAGGGSGLGLHICRRIIQGHAGNVTIQENETGTVFAIDVPWNDEGSDTPSAS